MRTFATAEAETLLTNLDPDSREALLSMYRGEPQTGADGAQHTIDRVTRISPEQGIWLHELCLSQKPKAIVEIGMAYGFSTICFLDAMKKNGFGHLTSIDPFQVTQWHGIGLTQARRRLAIGSPDVTFTLLSERSDHAAVDFARAGTTFDLVFIDGAHRFDDVLTDFYLYAPLCSIGGVLVFDDVRMSSIRTVVAYVRTNRDDFEELRTAQENVGVFRKVKDDTRHWRHFRSFDVAPSSGEKD